MPLRHLRSAFQYGQPRQQFERRVRGLVHFGDVCAPWIAFRQLTQQQVGEADDHGQVVLEFVDESLALGDFGLRSRRIRHRACKFCIESARMRPV